MLRSNSSPHTAEKINKCFFLTNVVGTFCAACTATGFSCYSFFGFQLKLILTSRRQILAGQKTPQGQQLRTAGDRVILEQAVHLLIDC